MNPDWDKLEACQQSLREHMEMVRERDERVERLTKLLTEAHDVIRDEVEANYPWKDKCPTHMRRYALDMDIVHRIAVALYLGGAA